MRRFSHQPSLSRPCGRSLSGVIVLLAALSLAAVTARLGWWQLQRAHTKEAAQALLDARMALPPLTEPSALARDAAQTEEQVHRPVHLRGTWMSEHTLFLDNRPHRGRPGFLVLTPLQTPQGVVVVQRGWHPRDLRDPTRLPTLDAQPGGTVEIRGRLSRAPSRLMELDAGGGGALRQNVDLAAWSRELGVELLPVTVQQSEPNRPCAEACAEGVPDGLVREWTVVASSGDKNRGYAVQWFALSGLTVVLWLWFAVFLPWRRRHSVAHE